VAGRWFSPGTPVSSTSKTDRHNITEILLKVAFNTINLSLSYHFTTKKVFNVIELMATFNTSRIKCRTNTH